MKNIGRINKDDANKFLIEIENKMSGIISNPPSFELPKLKNY